MSPESAAESQSSTEAAEAVQPASAPVRLIDSVIDATVSVPADAKSGIEAADRLARFLEEDSPAHALAIWLGHESPAGKRQLIQMLGRDIADLDELLTDQVNAILHQADFQKLEASWRGLEYLTNGVEDGANVKVRILDVSWKELTRDMERAIEFDSSQMFRKVYSDEFGMPGGEPYSVLLGDYEIHPRPSADHRMDDIATLRGISQVAAASFSPFISAAHPSMFDLEEFPELDRPLNLSRTFEHASYMKWKAFRDSEDSRFVGLTMPHTLMRLPYDDDGSRVDGFRYQEDVSAPDRSGYLWGNAAYAFGSVLVRAFSESGWMADIRGVQRDVEAGGLVVGLPSHSFTTDRTGLVPKSSTDVVVTDVLEKELSDLGFIPLCDCKDTEYSAFYSNQSTQKPAKHDRQAATMNAHISSMLQYMMCVSRFSHYLKVLARDRVGLFSDADDCQRFLKNWLSNYVTADEDASPEVKARYPLREAKIQVRSQPDKPGEYVCVAHLWPHFELDELSAGIKVKAELAPPRG